LRVQYDSRGPGLLPLLNVRWTLEREGALTLTWPPAKLGADQLETALVTV
jgi:hypothetical protein